MPQQLTADFLIHVGETIPITIDYATELNGDTIQTSTWSVFTGTTQTAETETTTATTLWLTGATASTRGVVINTTVSAGGKTLKRSYVIRVIA